VDLAKWPLQRAAFEKLSAFERGLDSGKAVSARGRGDARRPLGARRRQRLARSRRQPRS
jgi:hypothetical protein